MTKWMTKNIVFKTNRYCIRCLFVIDNNNKNRWLSVKNQYIFWFNLMKFLSNKKFLNFNDVIHWFEIEIWNFNFLLLMQYLVWLCLSSKSINWKKQTSFWLSTTTWKVREFLWNQEIFFPKSVEIVILWKYINLGHFYL